MADDPEPAENISGGTAGGGYADTFGADAPGTRAEAVVDRLGELYWQKAIEKYRKVLYHCPTRDSKWAIENRSIL